MAANNETYKRRAGTSAAHGHKFETDMVCSIYVRCLKLYKMNQLKSFRIANNMDHIGDFDDIVCRIDFVENGSLQSRIIFIQTKHKECPVKQPFTDETLLSPCKRRKTEKLPLIFEVGKSFLHIRQKLNEFEHTEKNTEKDQSTIVTKNFADIFRIGSQCMLLENAQFVYYTNATERDLKYFEKIHDEDLVTNIIDTSSNNGIYKLKLEDMELISLFEKMFENLNPNEVATLKDLLKSFRVYVKQESGQSLETAIKNDIKTNLSKENVDIDFLYKTLHEEIKNIHFGEYVPFITEQMNYVEKIYSLLKLQSETIDKKEKYQNWTKIFDGENVEKLYDSVVNGKAINMNYRKLDQSIVLVKILQLASKLEEINKCPLFLFICKDSFNKWREVRNLHNYIKYSEVLICIDNIPEADVNYVSNTEIATRELIVTISEKTPEHEILFWKQLSLTGLEQILNFIVNFQSLPVTLREIFGITDSQEIFDITEHTNVMNSLLSRVLNNENLQIGNYLPGEEKIYIERKYKKNSTLLKFEAINEKRDHFILYPKSNILESPLSTHDSKNVCIFESEEEAKNNFFSCVKINQNTHLCFVEASLEVFVSNGTLENVSKYKINQDTMNENEFLKLTMNNKCTIISNDVGIGKTTALKHLTHCIKKNKNDFWVEYIKLNMQEKKLKSLVETGNPIDTVTQLLNLDDVGKMVFQQKCYADGKVALLFDGFDEIDPDSRAQFLCLLRILFGTKIKNIVLSTRSNVEMEIKHSSLKFYYNIVDFNYEEIYSYLLKYWLQDDDRKNAQKLHDTTQDIINQLKELEDMLKGIISVPLQTKMLAETFSDKIKYILSSEDRVMTFEKPQLSLYSLYSNFINMHIDRCISDKFKVTDENISNYELIKESIFKRDSGIWEAIACQQLFPSVPICEVKVSDIDELAKQRIGIFVHTDQKAVTFVHRSFAEFLAAKHVSRMLYASKNTGLLNFFYQSVCVDRTFNVLRKFINAIYENEMGWETAFINYVPGLIVNDKILTVSVTKKNEFLFKVIIRHLSKNEDILKKLLNHKHFEQSLLHLSARYCEELFDVILNSDHFNCAENCDDDGLTALHLACRYGKEKCVHSYLSQFQNESQSAIINQPDIWMRTPLMLAARRGHTNIIQILNDLGATIHNKNDKGWNALMYASKGGCIDTVKYLMDQGAEINETDNEGETLLMHACENINYYRNGEGYIKYLVDTAGTDVNIQDCKGRTALMHLVMINANIDSLKLLIQHGADMKIVDSKGRNAVMLAANYGQIETVKNLFEMGVDILNQMDANGDTCFTLCSGADNTSVLQYFIEEHEQYLDFKNYEGGTALFRAVLYGRIKNVKLLITHGASVNICNKNGDTAISAAVDKNFAYKMWTNNCFSDYRKEFPVVVKYLLQNGGEINHQNNLGNSLLHLMLHLRSYTVKEVNIVKLIKLLVKHGADTSLKNIDGVTPVMIAQEHEDPDVKSYIEEMIRDRK